MFFGETEKAPMKENKNIPAKGENIETEINVKLEDAYYGAEKKISLRTVKGQMKTFSVKVPAGIRNGEKIRLLGQGKEGINGGKNILKISEGTADMIDADCPDQTCVKKHKN